MEHARIRNREKYHITPRNILPIHCPPRLMREKALAPRNELPPVARNLLQDTARLEHLRRLQAEHKTLANAPFDEGEPSRVNG